MCIRDSITSDGPAEAGRDDRLLPDVDERQVSGRHGVGRAAGIGAASVDFVYVLPAYPAPTASLAKMHISRHFVSCGGQMATALATCALMGLRSKLVGVTGTDDNAKQVRRELEGATSISRPRRETRTR